MPLHWESNTPRRVEKRCWKFTLFDDERLFLASTRLFDVLVVFVVGDVITDPNDGRHADLVNLVGRFLLIDVSSATLAEAGLSVGALNLFINFCEYFYGIT